MPALTVTLQTVRLAGPPAKCDTCRLRRVLYALAAVSDRRLMTVTAGRCAECAGLRYEGAEEAAPMALELPEAGVSYPQVEQLEDGALIHHSPTLTQIVHNDEAVEPDAEP